ncbi:MAG: hypothetical protein GEU96_03880 [Propionibacteriales bacterium]|nr:hypothetical protein [Propionibacteriales bacterium]
MGSSSDGVREAVATLQQAVERLRHEYGDTLGVRRLHSDVQRFEADLAELGDPQPGHRPGPAPEELEEIPDDDYDASMWSDAEQEGFGAPDRHAP